MVCFAVRRRSIISSVPVDSVFLAYLFAQSRTRIVPLPDCWDVMWARACWTHLCANQDAHARIRLRLKCVREFPKESHNKGNDRVDRAPLYRCYRFRQNFYTIRPNFSVCIRSLFVPVRRVGEIRAAWKCNERRSENSLWLVSGEISERNRPFAHHSIRITADKLHWSGALRMDSWSRAPLRSMSMYQNDKTMMNRFI